MSVLLVYLRREGGIWLCMREEEGKGEGRSRKKMSFAPLCFFFIFFHALCPIPTTHKHAHNARAKREAHFPSGHRVLPFPSSLHPHTGSQTDALPSSSSSPNHCFCTRRPPPPKQP